ncbi:MAG TPA: ion transporter, partial [Bacteroidales bacterium]|nr:ion transporter [Bacteroidales bacterium]
YYLYYSHITPHTMSQFKERLYEIIFEADTKAGKTFDIILITSIIISIIAVIFDSIPGLSESMHNSFTAIEWIITVFFTLEYFTRIAIVRKPLRYIFSFYGIIDFLAIIPTYLGIIVSGGSSLLVIRVLRLLRIFRVFKLSRYTLAGSIISRSLAESKAKIGVFLAAVTTIVIVIGTLMYLVEGSENGFTSIPRGIYWTIVTITTVGYGDIAPATALGQLIASLTMLTGYAIIAVPTGIVTAEISQQQKLLKFNRGNTQTCPECLAQDHEDNAEYCKHCGTKLN